jgi:hypothetical protein
LSSDICLKDQFFWVSNQRLSSLIAFALQVGAEMGRATQERAWVEKLMQFAEQEAWPGISFDLEERFPSVEEKKFWACVYHNVAQGIFLHRLGNHEVTNWQASAIGDAYVIARMLTRAVQEVETAWHPDKEHYHEDDGPCGEKKADADAAKKFVGKWKGTMKSPWSEFPVEIEIREFTFGKWCGDLKHDTPLDADGKLLGIKVEGKTMTLAQTVFRGRGRCLDGINVLTLTDEDTLERAWVDTGTGKVRDKGTLKRQAK